MDNQTELKLDWQTLPIPNNSFFPLVDMEERKKIAVSASKSACYVFSKWNECDELLAELLYYSWNDSELKERPGNKTIGETKEEQLEQFRKTVFKIAFSIARKSGCAFGVHVGAKKRTFYNKLYNAEENNERNGG